MQILRQVGDGRADLIMNGMAFLVRWPAHGHEFELQPGLFKPQQFLGDKSLGQARIALEEHHDFFASVTLRASLLNVGCRGRVTR